MKLWIKIAVIVMTLFLSACGGGVRQVINDNVTTTLSREIDREAGVVCWRFSASGIYCMPIKDTNLKY